MTTSFWRTMTAIIRKDIRAEFRSRELVSTMALFTLLSVMVFSFALELDRQARRETVSGVLWVTLVFASILGLNRSMISEREQGSMSAMILAPVDRTALYLGKVFGNFLFTVVVGLVLLPLITILYNINVSDPWMIVLLTLGTLGFTAIGTLIAAMTAQTRSRETLLPIAMLPVVLPVILTVVRASAGVMQDEFQAAWVVTLVVIDLLYLGMGMLMFEYVLEE